jgi:hypothetical protein
VNLAVPGSKDTADRDHAHQRPSYAVRPDRSLVLKAASALADGIALDALSREAHDAFAIRLRRWPAGSGRRILRLLLGAAAQASCLFEPSQLPTWTPIPFGAMRANLGRRGGGWRPSRRGQWLATLPIYAPAPSSLQLVAAALLRHLYPIEAAEELAVGLAGDYATALIAEEIIAFPPDDPARWRVRTGAVPLLGADAVLSALEAGEPLRIFATPLAWNRAGAATAPGCCVLDWSCGLARLLLIEASALIGDDRAHAAELHRRVSRRLPRIQFIELENGPALARAA